MLQIIASNQTYEIELAKIRKGLIVWKIKYKPTGAVFADGMSNDMESAVESVRRYRKYYKIPEIQL